MLKTFNFAKKDFTTTTRTGVVSRKGDYIVCPECGYDRSFLMTEISAGERVEWRCRECRRDWAGVVREDGTVEPQPVERRKKWVMVEIDEDFEPMTLSAWRHETTEEATRRTSDASTPQPRAVAETFTLTECLEAAEDEMNAAGVRRFKGEMI